MNDAILSRVVIENVRPSVDEGRFPAKGIVGDTVPVTEDIFADGHDSISARLLYRKSGEIEWRETAMAAAENDEWRGGFSIGEPGMYTFAVEGWIDRFSSWRKALQKKLDAGQEIGADLLIGARIVETAAERADGGGAARLRGLAETLKDASDPAAAAAIALGAQAAKLMAEFPDRTQSVRTQKEYPLQADPPVARFSTWYELFPRSCSPEPGKHGTFRDCEALLPEIAKMGFDVLYLPPIHPIGETNRKGKNNTTGAGPDDPGSPWAIGSEAGGHNRLLVQG